MAETADDNKLKEKLSATPPLPQRKTEETNSVAAEEERGEQEEAEAEKAGPVKSKHEDIKIPEDDKIDKLDELSSLEQEIAKMHNLQHDDDTETDQLAKELAEQVKDAGDSAAIENGNASNEAQLTDELVSRRRTPVNHNKDETASAATLKDVDLIALLKGTDQEQEQPTAAAAPAADQKSIELALAELDNVGVTIEGEGQYEIMEIDDGDNGSAASPVVLPAAVAAAAPKSAAKGKAKLSPEQARAVALEQMADLKAQTARRKEAAAKQQQQQQPQQQPMDIVSSLNDDWNEYDSGSDNNSNSHSNANSNLTAASKRPIAKKASKASSESVGNAKALTKSPTQSALDKLKAATTVEPANNNNRPEATGYKRTRVIKRKIIWDPDMPDAQKSLAQYATTKAGGSNSASPTATATVTSERPTTPRASGQESMKRSRPMTPKDVHKVAAKRVATPAKLNESNVASTTTANRRAQTPNGAASGSVVQVKKKKVSEIDRLMGDEGAANMMQAVEREQRELSGGESPNKPLMRKRSLTITGRQQQQQQPQKANSSELMSPTTPKKESPPKAYKRASTPAAAIDAVFKNNKAATPKPQPSDSWDYVYKQRASEESMIMRRRSNSSYSSNASASRLSLDNRPAAVANLSDDASDAPANDPAFKFLKPETKTNQRNDGSPPQTLANDLKQQQLPKESKASAKTELITLHKLEKVSQLIVNMQPSKTGYTYKLQLLQKLTEMLNKLAKSNDCNTVLLSVGQGQTFCQGIDCQELIASALDKRKSGANQLGLVLKTYLRTLLTFPKPLVAGVVGNLKNLGVMQLPLFDYVVSADDCSLETSYVKLGQLPEGYALWHNHPKVSSQIHNRLFLLGEQLQALELVTTVGGNSFIDKCCKARSVNDEALEVAKLISNSTAEHYRGLKKLNQTANAALLPSLDAEFKILTEQWASAQFQANCKRYVSDLNI